MPVCDQALYSALPDGGNAFFFADGTTVLWDATAEQKEQCMADIRASQLFPYENSFLESEDMVFEFGDPEMCAAAFFVSLLTKRRL